MLFRSGPANGGPSGTSATPNPLFTSLAAQPQLQGAYFYEIEIPAAAVALGFDLELRVSCHQQGNSGDLNWAVYAPDGTDTDFTDNVAAGPMATGDQRRADNTNCVESEGQWVGRDGVHTQYNDTADWIKLDDMAIPGKYILRARTISGQAMYSIRVTRPGFPVATAHCTSIPLPNEADGTDPA